MAMCIIGAVLAIISPFILFMVSMSGDISFAGLHSYGMGPYAYGWLILVGGILVLIFSIIAYAIQHKIMALLTVIFALIAFIMPIVLAAHMVSDVTSASTMGTNILEIFYHTESYYGYTFTTVFIGGLLTMIGALLASIGGVLLLRKINKTHPAPQQPKHHLPQHFPGHQTR